MSLPSGIDRADGLAGRLGTPDPSGAIKIFGPGNTSTKPIEESPESPTIERAEQATIRKAFTLSWSDALTELAALGRGLVRTDSLGNKTFLLSATAQHLPGDMANLTTVEEAVSFDPPPDLFSVEMVNLGLHILKHPRYFYALQGADATERARNQYVIRAVQQYMEDPSYPSRNQIPKMIKDGIGHANDDGYLPGTDLAKRAALEIIQKFWSNIETPYVVGLELVWTQFYFRPVHLHPGGVREDPITEANPQVPEYFWFCEDGTSIISQFSTFNPQSYSSSGESGGTVTVSWLRNGDKWAWERTWFRVTRSWLGSPVGFWDPELYTRQNRPSATTDYLDLDTTKAMPDYLTATSSW